MLAWCADHGVVIEVMPDLQRWFTGAIPSIADHPAPRFRDAGVPVVLGDDNPLQTGSDLAEERDVLVRVLGWTKPQLDDLDRASVAAAFLEPSQRGRLLAALSA